MALLSFISSFVLPVPAIVFGHVALRQIAATSERGRRFAIAGLWIGYAAFIAGGVCVWIVVTTAISTFLPSFPA